MDTIAQVKKPPQSEIIVSRTIVFHLGQFKGSRPQGLNNSSFEETISSTTQNTQHSTHRTPPHTQHRTCNPHHTLHHAQQPAHTTPHTTLGAQQTAYNIQHTPKTMSKKTINKKRDPRTPFLKLFFLRNFGPRKQTRKIWGHAPIATKMGNKLTEELRTKRVTQAWGPTNQKFLAQAKL